MRLEEIVKKYGMNDYYEQSTGKLFKLSKAFESSQDDDDLLYVPTFIDLKFIGNTMMKKPIESNKAIENECKEEQETYSDIIKNGLALSKIMEPIIEEFIAKCIITADDLKINRDRVIQVAGQTIFSMVELGTFKDYEI